MEVMDIIETLRMENDLITFDPSTGDDIDPQCLNDLNKKCYTAHAEAIKFIEKSIPISWIENWDREKNTEFIEHIFNNCDYKSSIKVPRDIKRVQYKDLPMVHLIAEMLDDWKKENGIN